MAIVLSTPVYAILSGLYLVGLGLGLLFFILRRHQQPISTRSISLSVVSVVYGLLHFINLSIDLSVIDQETGETLPGWTCSLSLYSSILLLPLWAMPYFLRSFMVIYKYNWHLEKIQLRADPSRHPSGGWHHSNKKVLSGLVQFIVIAVAVSVHVIVALGFQWSGFDPFNGRIRACSAPHILAMGVLTLFYLAFLIVLIVKIIPVKDIFYIKIELLSVMCVTIPCFVVWMTSFFVTFPDSVQSSWFAMLVVFLTGVLTLGIPLYLSTRREWIPLADIDLNEMRHVLNSSQKASRSARGGTVDSEMSAMTQKTVSGVHDNKEGSLAWYLQDEIFSSSFEKYCVQAWCVELYLFYKDAPTIKEVDDLQLKAEVERIKKLYIDPDSPLEVELEDATMQDITKNFTEGNVTRAIFDKAIEEVYSNLMAHVFGKWKRSPLFLEAKVRVSAPREESVIVTESKDLVENHESV